MIKRIRSYEVTVAFESSWEDKQFLVLKTVFFNVTKNQLINSMADMIQTYVGQTDGHLKYAEAMDFYTKEVVELPESYPKPAPVKGVLHGNKI